MCFENFYFLFCYICSGVRRCAALCTHAFLLYIFTVPAVR
jgi:hypothetical protein